MPCVSQSDGMATRIETIAAQIDITNHTVRALCNVDVMLMIEGSLVCRLVAGQVNYCLFPSI